ncbi:hypothetical protein [Actinophytocola sp.]|uniref:hypothetical protein n=1 Tax=Actinophytocola sp. TaxID=1872138 RepID=UPI002D4D6E55|nr:hypothetical protein [Actinophytocola sp.]HYQ69088.1 hypothetical protein [Actinophytocola sp.]
MDVPDLDRYQPEQVVEQLTGEQRAMLAAAAPASERGRRLRLGMHGRSERDAQALVRLGLVDPLGEYRDGPYALTRQGVAVRRALVAMTGEARR